MAFQDSEQCLNNVSVPPGHGDVIAQLFDLVKHIWCLEQKKEMRANEVFIK